MQPKRVVIVDDSPTMRAMIARVLAADGRFAVVGEAGDPFEAREVIKRADPDVITLDVEMPRMDGISFLEKIMRLRPMPVVMFSSETHRGSRAAVEALSLGAVDALGKPTTAAPEALAALAERVFIAANASVGPQRAPRPAGPAQVRFSWNGRVVLIGASTGGVDALERVLGTMPAEGPPVLVAQHMPGSFLESFAERLQGQIAPRVALARPGAPVSSGRVYFAPGGEAHLVLEGAPGRFRCGLAPGEKVNGHRPSVDALFRSALACAPHVVAAILTGMGRDGAEGIAALRAAGAHTIGQDAASCVVYGMPRIAAELGGVAEVRPLDAIGAALLRATGCAPGQGVAPPRGAEGAA
jgi:two-component system chemotaxis response regulator CheB